jgi:hypothetical protein
MLDGSVRADAATRTGKTAASVATYVLFSQRFQGMHLRIGVAVADTMECRR